MPFIFGFMLAFMATMVVAAVFIKPLMKLLIYFIIYVVLPVLFVIGFGLFSFALFFVVKAEKQNYWQDFGLLVLVIALYISTLTHWGLYFVAYMGVLFILTAFMLGFWAMVALFECYQKYKNADEYKAKKAQKEKEVFSKNYKKAEILLENIRNKELAKALDDSQIARIESRNESLKNAFEFLANKHKIIINKQDIKTINKITEYFALPSGDELMRYESAYREILARHKVTY